jgi:hypothetical protein
VFYCLHDHLPHSNFDTPLGVIDLSDIVAAVNGVKCAAFMPIRARPSSTAATGSRLRAKCSEFRQGCGWRNSVPRRSAHHEKQISVATIIGT